MILWIVSIFSAESEEMVMCTNLDDLVPGEFEAWDVHRIASHEIAVQNSENRLMGNDEKVILLSLQLQNNRFKADGKVMVRL